VDIDVNRVLLLSKFLAKTEKFLDVKMKLATSNLIKEIIFGCLRVTTRGQTWRNSVVKPYLNVVR
jgi:hypothetical protein